MGRMHINDAGEPGDCNANFNCPFGSLDEDHYDTPQEAREAYEKKMETEGYVFKSHKFGAPPFVPATKEELAKSSENAKAVLNKSGLLTGRSLSQTDKNLVQKVLDGKKVSDEKIDSFLDRNFALEKPGDNEYNDPKDINKVFDHIRLVRKQSQTPSTLTTLDAFDPATQSVVGSTVRSSPNKMAKAMQKSLNSINHLQSLADTNFYTAETDESLTDEQRAFYRGRGEIHLEESKREEVRLDALHREMQWQLENDPKFAWQADPRAVSASKRFKFRSNPGKYSVGTVRTVKDDE